MYASSQASLFHTLTLTNQSIHPDRMNLLGELLSLRQLRHLLGRQASTTRGSNLESCHEQQARVMRRGRGLDGNFEFPTQYLCQYRKILHVVACMRLMCAKRCPCTRLSLSRGSVAYIGLKFDFVTIPHSLQYSIDKGVYFLV